MNSFWLGSELYGETMNDMLNASMAYEISEETTEHTEHTHNKRRKLFRFEQQRQ